MTTIFTAFDSADLTASIDTRTIEGTAIRYDEPGKPGGSFGGKATYFHPESLTRSLNARSDKVRLLVQHDQTRPVGRLVEFANTDVGLTTRWKIANTPAGDVALAEAADGVRDGLSVGVEVIDFTERSDAWIINEAKLVEVSLVAFPAYDSARVTRVAASQTFETGRDPRIVRLNLLLNGDIRS